jgi:hypothetical protein
VGGGGDAVLFVVVEKRFLLDSPMQSLAPIELSQLVNTAANSWTHHPILFT